jgi:hypothetical protein
MKTYKDEWIALLLKQKISDWLIGTDGNHIIINVTNDQDLDALMIEFQKTIKRLHPLIKNKPSKLGFFIGNSKDSKFFEL